MLPYSLVAIAQYTSSCVIMRKQTLLTSHTVADTVMDSINVAILDAQV